MVVHDGIAENLDAHDAGEKLQTLADQSASMIEVFAGKLVIAAEKCTSDTAIDAVHHLNVLICQHIAPICSSHDERPRLMPLWVQDNEMQLRGKNSTRTDSGCQMTDGWPREAGSRDYWQLASRSAIF